MPTQAQMGHSGSKWLRFCFPTDTIFDSFDFRKLDALRALSGCLLRYHSLVHALNPSAGRGNNDQTTIRQTSKPTLWVSIFSYHATGIFPLLRSDS